MLLTMLKSKLHGAVVTSCLPDYEGSIAIDRSLLRAAGILPNEKVLVASLANGNRLETYAIPAEEGSGTVSLNGAAAFLGSPGDRLIVLAFALMPPTQARKHRPKVLRLTRKNRPAD